MMKFLLAGILASVGTAAVAEDIYTPHELTRVDIERVEAGVKEVLKDPDSARFSGFGASVSDGGTIVACGFVNAKNSLGGYTGRSPFMGLIMRGTYETKFVVVSMGSDPDEETVTRQMCEKNGISSP